MTKATIEWKQWGTFKNLEDLFQFIKSSNKVHYQMFWPTGYSPILQWLN